jgi:large subunit ribosomal protein L25
MTMARELQRHPVRNTVIHVDFQVVDPNREITSEVPITLIGEAIELHRADGILDQQLFALPIRSRPSDIPPHLEVDISELIIGSAVRVSDIALPAGVTTDLDPESVVAAGQAPRVAEVAEGVEGEEAAEGAEAAAETTAAGGEPSGDADGEEG